MDNASLLVVLSGLSGGLVLGFVARRNFFCTLSALEQHWYAGNSDGLRTWALAAVFATLFTQILVAVGLFEPTDSFYLTPYFGLPAAVIGGICFGFGMALIGTCGFGALVRVGGGSLKSLIAILVLGLVALSTQRGILALGRIGVFDRISLDLTFAGSQSLPDLASAYAGRDLSLPVTVLAIAVPAAWILSNRDFRQNRKAVATSCIIGLVIAFGWLSTSILGAHGFVPVQIESASFVTPVADTILQFAVFTGAMPDYGVGMVLGTIIGAALAAKQADDIRWEACDDAAELSRHIIGAALMGFGGVLALGCTVGQGISAASLLAVSVPVTVISIGFGARMGLAWLLEGSALAPFRGHGVDRN